MAHGRYATIQNIGFPGTSLLRTAEIIRPKTTVSGTDPAT
jgi:hypothetical protein